jgi:hypothetical protein
MNTHTKHARALPTVAACHEHNAQKAVVLHHLAVDVNDTALPCVDARLVC